MAFLHWSVEVVQRPDWVSLAVFHHVAVADVHDQPERHERLNLAFVERLGRRSWRLDDVDLGGRVVGVPCLLDLGDDPVEGSHGGPRFLVGAVLGYQRVQ